MAKITKAVIPVAGLGLNFLPTTKATAKEMLPIVDKPIMQFVVEEALASGIEEFVIVTGRHKRSIEDHFDANFDLEQNLLAKQKDELYQKATETTLDNVYYVRQPYPRGLGDAVLQAQEFVGNEPFVVLLADNIMPSELPITQQLIEQFDKVDASVISVQESDEVEDLSSYGVVDVKEEISERLHTVNKIVEKPEQDKIEGSYASTGRYVLTPAIFDFLESQEPDADGQIQLSEAISRLNQKEPVYAYQFEGERYDVGDVEGYLEANILYGLKHPETADEFKDYLIDLAEKLKSE